jgi:L-ascorbate metabolism protein UlaG (beta-lactamase superfamily)
MTAPHHRAEGGFCNPWPGDRARGLADFLRWRRERRAAPRRSDGAPLKVSASAFTAPRAAPGELTATWVGHSTVLLQLGPVNILTDPMWSRRASPVWWVGPARRVKAAVPLRALPPVDLVLLSHDHYDHLDRRTVRRLRRRHPEAMWYAPLGVEAHLRRWGVRQAQALDWGDAAVAKGATVACVPARHFSGRSLRDRGRTLWAGWVISAGPWRVYFAGDTAYHPDFARLATRHGPFDLALLPIGAYAPRWLMETVHMDPDEVVRAYTDLASAHPGAPPSLLPIHWGVFSLSDEPMSEPPTRVRAGWAAAGLPQDNLWMLNPGETRRLERGG